MEAGHAVENRRPLLRRQIDRVLARLAALLLRRMHERLADPLMRQQIAQVFPRLIQLVLVIAARVFPVPHPRRRAGVEGAHRHAEIDRRTGAFEARPHRVLRNRHAGIQAPRVRRLAAEKSVEHPLADVAHGRRVAVGVADLRLGRQEGVAALAAAHLFLKRVARAQQRAELVLRVARQLRDQLVDVDPPPVDRLVAKERPVFFVDIRPDRY